MLTAFVAGAIAGYGLAIPLGAVGMLIMESSLRGGLQNGLAAAYGTSTVDVGYAALSALGGTALAAAIQPASVGLRWLAVVVLAAVGVRGVLAARAAFASDPNATGETANGASGESALGLGDGRARLRRTYLRFVGLTLINPMTVAYFAALIVGLPPIGTGAAGQMAFVAGVGLASFSWSSVLALIGAVVGRRLLPSARLWTSVAGNAIVLVLAAGIAARLVAGS